MQRVAIIGPGGAGKSTLATDLAARTGLPVFHLDRIFWRPGWTPAPEDEARPALAQIVAGERWIIDGNFLALGQGGRDARFERADTVIFLDLPTAVCLWQALSRAVRDRGRSDRADLPDGCPEGLDLPFLRWIWSYRRRDRPRVLGLLSRLEGRVTVHRLRSRREMWRFAELSRRPAG